MRVFLLWRSGCLINIFDGLNKAQAWAERDSRRDVNGWEQDRGTFYSLNFSGGRGLWAITVEQVL